MGPWSRRLGIVLVLTASAAYLRQATAGASRQDPAQSQMVRRLKSGHSIVMRQLADSGTERPAPVPRVPDPDLEPGFPVQALSTAGTYISGPQIHTLVGNIDRESDLEIVVTGLATGPLYAWKHDGKLVPGWPVSRIPGAGYPALGDLGRMILPLRVPTAFEVFSGHTSGGMGAWWGNGAPVKGWPRQAANFVSSPASLTDIDGDARDEIFIGEADHCVHGYAADGTPLPGWPVCQDMGGQYRIMPTIADLDGDEIPEMLVTAGTPAEPYLFAYHPDGTMASGFPVLLPYPAGRPVVGDVDGDGELDIVMAMEEPSQPFHVLVGIHSRAGVLKRVLRPIHDSLFGMAPALADLDADGFPEIIVGTDGALDAWKGDGSVFPGWPRVWSQSGHWLGDSAAVVGDVDGDGAPDIVITTQYAGRSDIGEVHVYDRFGNLHPRFPKVLAIGFGAVPAIADIDRDGRNEIIVSGNFWNGFSGMYDKVWVYDLGGGAHGPVLWGQFMGGPRHQGRYEGPPE